MNLTIKLKESASADATLTRLSQEISGILKIKRLFPEETDLELTTLYIVTVDPSNTDSVLKQLSEDQDVEFVEKPPRRKIIL